MNILKNSFYLLLAGVLASGFTACSDDEPDIIDDDEEEIVEWVRLTEDDIQNHIDLHAAVYGWFDEVTERVIARITFPRIGNTAQTEFISEDTELVIMDNNTLLGLSKEQIDALHDAYQRGVICYLHKPNAMGVAFFYAAMELGSDALLAPSFTSKTRANDDSWLYPYDVVMMHKDKGYYRLANVYSKEPITYTTIVEEIDNETNESISSREEENVRYQTEPNAYEYGLHAESIAEWINKPAETKSPQTRADNNNVLDEVPGEDHFPMNFWNAKTGDRTEALSDFILRYWISSLYNFDLDQDYYHVTLQEEYDASKGYKGRYAVKSNTWGLYDTKYMGEVYNGPHITVDFWKNREYKLLHQWNEQPTPEGAVKNEEKIEGWNVGASVGWSDGFVCGMNASYVSQTAVSSVKKEVNFTFENNSKEGYMKWEYDYGAKSAMLFSNAPQPKVTKEPEKDALCRNLSRNMQSWNWVVANTKKRKANDLDFGIRLDVKRYHKIATPNGSSNKQELVEHVFVMAYPIKLPIPNRYKHTYSLDHGTIYDPDEWNSIYPILTQGSSNFAMFDHKESRCNKSEEALDKVISTEWEEAGKELGNLKFPNLKNTYRIGLKDENNRKCGKTLVIDNQSIRME